MGLAGALEPEVLRPIKETAWAGLASEILKPEVQAGLSRS